MQWGNAQIKVWPKQNDPTQPEELLKELAPKLGLVYPSLEQQLLSLANLVLELRVDSETTMLRFLEQQPQGIYWDKIKRRHYILSGTVSAFREVYVELKEQKVAKALLIFLCAHFEALFKDLWPKHGLVPPLGIEFKLLGLEEITRLELPLRLRHEYLLVHFKLACLEILELYALGFSPVLGTFFPEEVLTPDPLDQSVLALFPTFWEKASEKNRPYLYPLAGAQEGFLFLPLLSYLALFTKAKAKGRFLPRILSALWAELKALYPEPFGLLPED